MRQVAIRNRAYKVTRKGPSEDRRREREREWYAKNQERTKARKKKWRQEHPERILEYNRRSRTKRSHLKWRRTWEKSRYQEVRKKVIKHYGGRCKCCGESCYGFLTLDHIKGGGTQHRLKTGLRGSQLYLWLKRKGYPTGYQILCYNCNCAIGHYGICPHKGEPKKDYVRPVFVNWKF